MRNIAVLLCVLCVPYVCTVLWGNAGKLSGGAEETDAVPVLAASAPGGTDGIHYLTMDHGWYAESLDTETYITKCLAEYVPNQMKAETMKALAVILRTGLKDGSIIAHGKSMPPVTEDYRHAAEDTRGIILTYEGSPVNALWTCVSNGSTRDGTENRIASSDYLKKRNCQKDILAAEYSSQAVYEKAKFIEILADLSGEGESGGVPEQDDFGWPIFVQLRDSAGYTKKILIGAKEIEGSVFADAFCLKSPSFDMEFQEEKVIFHVTGCGHGFGMSLYAADRMAEEGKDFMEILSFFYPGTELRKL